MGAGISAEVGVGIEQPQRAADAVEGGFGPAVLKVIAGALEQVAELGKVEVDGAHGAPRRARQDAPGAASAERLSGCRIEENAAPGGSAGAVSRAKSP